MILDDIRNVDLLSLEMTRSYEDNPDDGIWDTINLEPSNDTESVHVFFFKNSLRVMKYSAMYLLYILDIRTFPSRIMKLAPAPIYIDTRRNIVRLKK
jgi:hypothetical protein